MNIQPEMKLLSRQVMDTRGGDGTSTRLLQGGSSPSLSPECIGHHTVSPLMGHLIELPEQFSHCDGLWDEHSEHCLIFVHLSTLTEQGQGLCQHLQDLGLA